MNLFKRSFVGIFIFAIALMGQATFTQAQEVAEYSPQVAVDNLVLTGASYKAGDTITGTFDLINIGDISISNLSFDVALVGDLQTNSLYLYEFDHSISDKVFLDRRETKTIRFQYTLPLSSSAYSLGRQLGIKVKVYSGSGEYLSWTDTKVTIADSGLTPVIPSDVKVVIGKNSFFPNEGGMVYEGGKVFLTLKVANDSDKAINLLTPNVSVFDMNYASDPLKEYSGERFSVNAKSKVDLKIELPTFEYTPKVYAGELTIVDENGVARSNPVAFRYIVSGDIVNIQNVLSDKISVNKGEEFNVAIVYSGTPDDILQRGKAGTESSAKEYDLSVRVNNEEGESVAEYSGKATFDLFGTENIKLLATEDADSLSFAIVVSKDGKVITEYNTILESADAGKTKSLLVTYLVIIISFIIAVIAFIIGKRRGHILAGTMTVVGAIIIATALYAFTPTMVYNYQWAHDTNANITLNVTTPNQSGAVYNPGATITVRGTSATVLCNNNDTNIKVYTSTATTTSAQAWPHTGVGNSIEYFATGMTLIGDNNVAHSSCPGMKWCPKNFEFAGSVSAPTTQGDYNIHLFARSSMQSDSAFTYAYKLYTFAVDVVGERVYNNPASSAGGFRIFNVIVNEEVKPILEQNSCNSVLLSWDAVSDASSYKVYRGLSVGTLEQIATTKQTSLIDSPLPGGTKYYFAIKSSNTQGDSATSTVLSITLDPCIQGACGTNAKTYYADGWPTGGTFCALGTPSENSIVFPKTGDAAWLCVGNTDWNPTCVATRSPISAGNCEITQDAPKPTADNTFYINKNISLDVAGDVTIPEGSSMVWSETINGITSQIGTKKTVDRLIISPVGQRIYKFVATKGGGIVATCEKTVNFIANPGNVQEQ